MLDLRRKLWRTDHDQPYRFISEFYNFSTFSYIFSNEKTVIISIFVNVILINFGSEYPGFLAILLTFNSIKIIDRLKISHSNCNIYFDNNLYLTQI